MYDSGEVHRLYDWGRWDRGLGGVGCRVDGRWDWGRWDVGSHGGRWNIGFGEVGCRIGGGGLSNMMSTLLIN